MLHNNKLKRKLLLSKDNSKKSSIKKVKDNALKKDRKSSLFIEEHFKMELNSIPIKTETVPLNLIWVRAESSKVGMKDLPPWKEAKKQHLSARRIMLMAKEDHHQEFHQTQLWTSKLSFSISKTKSKKNGRWAISKRFPKQPQLRIKETKHSKRANLKKQTDCIKKVLNLLRMMIMLRL